jgi:hypothetical protein
MASLSTSDRLALIIGIPAMFLLWLAGGYGVALGVFLALWANNISQGCVCRRQ